MIVNMREKLKTKNVGFLVIMYKINGNTERLEISYRGIKGTVELENPIVFIEKQFF